VVRAKNFVKGNVVVVVAVLVFLSKFEKANII